MIGPTALLALDLRGTAEPVRVTSDAAEHAVTFSKNSAVYVDSRTAATGTPRFSASAIAMP